MPIEVNMHDNTSKIHVSVNSNSKADVPSANNTLADKRLYILLDKEKEERIAADEDLQHQIDNVDIRFIYITQVPEGHLTPYQLELLNKNKVNRLVIGNVIYYLSVVDGNIRKYFSRIEENTNNEIQVDMTTGYYLVISKMNPDLKEHIENTDIHISAEERLFWNNKVSATAEDVPPSDPKYSGDKILILTTDDIYNCFNSGDDVEGD